MTKQELCREIFEEMLEEGILNEADAYDISLLQKEVEIIIGRHLEDYALVCKAGILNDQHISVESVTICDGRDGIFGTGVGIENIVTIVTTVTHDAFIQK